MSLERRSFLKSGMLTTVSAIMALGSARLAFGQKGGLLTRVIDSQTPIKAQREPTYFFTSATFEPYVNGIFQAPDARGELVSLTLVSVTDYKPEPDTRITTGLVPALDSFSLMFKAARPLPEFTSIHTMSHPSLGKFNIFLTPRQTDDGMFYEAVFNHFK
jgi:hypothetical protein